MVAAVEKAGVANMVSFNYRRVPAISLAKQIIDEGRIGRPFHYRATYNQDYTISADVPQGGMALWRLDAHVAGSGVTGDLLAHSIDTAEWLNGPIQRVVAHTETFVKERKHAETGKVEPVTHRRRLHVPGHLRQRLDGHVREHPLRPRPEELQHLRAQRRERLRSSSTWKIRTSCSTSATPIPATGKKIERPPDRLAADPRHQLRASLHEELVGARLHDRLRAHVHQRPGRFPGEPRRRRPSQPDFRAALGRKRSATRCWPAPRAASGSRSLRISPDVSLAVAARRLPAAQSRPSPSARRCPARARPRRG